MFSRRVAFLCAILVSIAALAQSGKSTQDIGESQFSLTDRHLKAVGLRFEKGVDSIDGLIQQSAKQQETQEIKLLWNSFPGTTSPVTATEASRLQPSSKFVPQSRQFLADAPAHQAEGQMYSDTFLFVAVGKSDRIRGLIIQRDPRLMFWDSVDPKGRLTGGVMYQPKAEFTLRFPNAPDIKRVLVFQPRFTETGFSLDLLSTVDLKKIKG